MADHFLTKSQVDLSDCLPAGDDLIIEKYEALTDYITEGAGPSVARLFAEPLISRGNDVAAPTIAWYSDFDGQGVPFSHLDSEARADLSDVLSRRLAALPDLINDTPEGQLVASALHTLGPDSVWSVGGRPVILNWGMLPEAARGDARAREKHYTAALGRFLPGDAPPLPGEGDAAGWSAGRAGAVAAAGAATAAVAAGQAAASPSRVVPPAAAASGAKAGAGGAGAGADSANVPPPPPPPSGTPRRVPVYAWLPLVVLLVLFSGVLIWLLLPGNRIVAEAQPEPAITDEAAVRMADSVNEALRARVAELEKGLAGAICEADGTLVMPEGVMIEGMLPPRPETPMQAQKKRVTAVEHSILPADLTRLQAVASADDESVRDMIRARTVLVMTETPNGIGTGTGFVIAPNTVLTNNHVVDGARPGSVSVTNKELGKATMADVVKSSGAFEVSGSDFALLSVPGLNLPAFPIYLGDVDLERQAVFAAGYPGDVLLSDSEFTALRAGDREAVPTLTITDGKVLTEETVAATTHVVVHSAPISQGNSGGPLVDACGRVVGVNTFVRRGTLMDQNFALSSRDLLGFLEQTQAVPTVVSQVCKPELLRPSVRTVQSGSAPAPETPAPGGAPSAKPGLPALVKPKP
ncbi:trypsin-like peptidase domain-containing protein [Pseudooceanicola sp. C21-150M6]|uniref:S1C family serine protease n=1 Tax=Pseudooceanicola sp. C21-150M6 TaxID=3434355 RepID=UPI003D7F6C80